MGTVYIDFRSISWGAPDEDDNTDVWSVENSADDPNEITLADLGSVSDPVKNLQALKTIPLNGKNYEFAFWNATDGVDALPGYPNSDPARLLNIPLHPAASVIYATAWYATPGDGNGKPGLRARTFDIDLNAFRKETPVSAVTPANAWPGPNSHWAYTADSGVTVVPKDHLLYPEPTPNQVPGTLPKRFKRWQKIWGTPVISAPPSETITLAAKRTALALAFYGHSPSPSLGTTVNDRTFDFWAEFWGKRGVEGEGPWGPRGPAGPWGPRIARGLASLSAQDQEAFKSLVEKMAGKIE
ncbi:hypothetical protein [Methylogaea oryzae]|uniref:Uncharacterized protein n=1 Tax=Methylogaea oryzae TaxID=1295382 RepID=A0A8D4VPC5_9GAMM|nr:hypothetical protein [Methylogaea oryzae]BBL70899.1 hypothetical protein MoryE10_15050 [Methylogaea oryzae]